MLKRIKDYDLIFTLLLLMPIIDALTTILGISLSLAIRGLFLIILFYIFLFKIDKKERNKRILPLFIIGLFFSIYMIHFYSLNGTFNIRAEAITLIKFLYLPVLLIILSGYIKNKKVNLLDFVSKLGLIYTILIIIPVLFNFSLNSYEYSKLGFCGLFYSPNELSSILAILAPFIILNYVKNENSIKNIIILTLFIISCFIIGTKTPVLSLFISLIASLIILIFQAIFKNKNTKKILLITLLIIISFGLYEKSYLKQNMYQQDNTYENINSATNINNPNTTNKVDELQLYNTLINFPTKRTYGETIDNKILNLIFSSRNIYFQNNINKYLNASNQEKLFGLTTGPTKNDTKTSNLSELDMVDIFVFYGILGTIVILGYIILLSFKTIITFFGNFKENILDFELCATCLSFMISILIAFTAGHVLGAPAVSIYLALNLAYLTEKLNLSKNSTNSSKLIYIALIIIAVISIIYILIPQKSVYELNLKLNNNHLNSASPLIKVQTEYTTYNNIHDTLNYYVIENYKNIEIIHVKRKLEDDNIIDFIAINNRESKQIKVNVILSEEVKEIQKNNNSIYIKDDKSKLISYTYKYNNEFKNIKNINKNATKNLISINNDNIAEKNVITKSFYMDPKTCADFYIIESKANLITNNEEIPWLAFNGIYTKYDNNIYYKNIENLDLANTSSAFAKILKDNYYISLHRYSSHKENIWYKDFIDYNITKNTNFDNGKVYLNAAFNNNIYATLENLQEQDMSTYYNAYSTKLLNDYYNKKYTRLDKDVVLNSIDPTFNNIVGNVDLLLKSYQINNNYQVLGLAKLLLESLNREEWIKDEWNLHSFINSDLKFVDDIIDKKTTINNLNKLSKNLKKANIDNSRIEKYIKILEEGEIS